MMHPYAYAGIAEIDQRQYRARLKRRVNCQAPTPETPKLVVILRNMCLDADIPYDTVISQCRKKHTVNVRKVFAHYCYTQIPNTTFRKIGQVLGKRDHTTVINLVNVANDHLINEREFCRLYTRLTTMV